MQWATFIPPLLALAGVLVTIIIGVKTTRRTLRANILATHRLKWLDTLRDEMPQLLAMGERLYDGGHLTTEAQVETKDALRLSSKRLIVLMGREDELRMEFAEAVRDFTAAPTALLADKLEVLAQKVFRARWNQVRTETGELPRLKPTLDRPAPQVATDEVSPDR